MAYTDPTWAVKDGHVDPSMADLERDVFGDAVELILGSFSDGRFLVDEDSLLSLLPDVDALVVYRAQLTKRLVDALPDRCRVVARQGDGTDNLALEALEARAMWSFNVPDYCVDEASTHALALVLSGERGCVAQDNLLKRGGWEPRATPTPRRTSELALGIVGFGRLGKAIALKARAFFGAITFFDPHIHKDLGTAYGVSESHSVTHLMATSHIVVVAAELLPATTHLIGPRELSALGEGSGLVNISRGRVVDSRAVLQGLNDGRLAWYATDVFEEEPPPMGSPSAELASHPRVTASCHRGFLSSSSERSLRVRVAQQTYEVLTENLPPTVGRLT